MAASDDSFEHHMLEGKGADDNDGEDTSFLNTGSALGSSPPAMTHGPTSDAEGDDGEEEGATHSGAGSGASVRAAHNFAHAGQEPRGSGDGLAETPEWGEAGEQRPAEDDHFDHREESAQHGEREEEGSPEGSAEGLAKHGAGDGRDLVGCCMWAKLGRFPWWPAQVLDASRADAGLQRERPSETDVLVRFFGTHDFAWVEPTSCLSDISVNYAERSRQRKKLFAKGLEEAEAFRRNGILPPNWNVVDSDLVSHDQGVSYDQNEADAVGGVKRSHSGNKGRRTRRKTKASNVSKKMAAAQKQEEKHISRRIRIMVYLGLCPPPGSPFNNIH